MNVLKIRLVQQYDDVLRHFIQKLNQLVAMTPGACRVIRVCHEHDAGTLINCTQHCFKIMTEVFCRYSNTIGTYRTRDQAVYSKRVLRYDNVVTVIHKHPDNKIENIA